MYPENTELLLKCFAPLVFFVLFFFFPSPPLKDLEVSNVTLLHLWLSQSSFPPSDELGPGYGMSQSSRLSSSVSAMRVLNTGSDVEEAVADALVLFSISFSLEIFQLRNSRVGKPVPQCGEGHGEKLVDSI